MINKIVLLMLLVLSVVFNGQGATSLNVRSFGAVGNGTTDDYAAIQKGLAELRKFTDAELYFPPGYYRIGTAAEAALDLTGYRRAGIRFAPGAVLMMDNRQGLGKLSGHAIKVGAPAEGLLFDGVNVEWKVPPEVRAPGDGFHITGLDAEGGVSHVTLSDCRVAHTPGRGIFFDTAAFLKLRSVLVADTRGEGVVFQSCEDITLFKLTVQRSRADSLCLIPAAPLPPEQSWSNRRIVITQAEISDGEGAGIRLGGVEDLTTEFVTIAGKQIGVSVESGNDLPVVWNAPVKMRLNDLDVQNCLTGVALVCRSPAVAALRAFDVKLDNCRLNGNGNDNLSVSGVDQLSVSKLRANSGRVRMSDFQDMKMRELRIRGGYCVISEVKNGQGSEFSNVTLDRAYLVLDKVDGTRWNDVAILDSPETALEMRDCRQVEFNQLKLTRPNRKSAENCRALWVARCRDLTLSGVDIELDSRLVVPLDLSGGALKIVGSLKAPAEYYALDSLLRLPPGLDAEYPQLNLELTARLGEDSFVLQQNSEN